MKKFVLLAVMVSVLMVTVGCSQNSKKGGPGGNAMPITAGNVERPDEVVAPEIAAVYQGVIVRVVNRKTETAEDVLVPFSTPTTMGNTPLVVTVVQFLPDFTMGEQGMQTKSMEPNNVGVKIHVTGDAAGHFNGWLFANFPEVHPYESEEFSLVVVEAVKK